MEELPYDQYLGDGVYASFDGYHVWLAVNHHTNKVVALEPSVFTALTKYVDSLKATLRAAQPTLSTEQEIPVEHSSCDPASVRL